MKLKILFLLNSESPKYIAKHFSSVYLQGIFSDIPGYSVHVYDAQFLDNVVCYISYEKQRSLRRACTMCDLIGATHIVVQIKSIV